MRNFLVSIVEESRNGSWPRVWLDLSAQMMPWEIYLYPPRHSTSLSSSFTFRQIFLISVASGRSRLLSSHLINTDERQVLHPKSSNKSFQQKFQVWLWLDHWAHRPVLKSNTMARPGSYALKSPYPNLREIGMGGWDFPKWKMLMQLP